MSDNRILPLVTLVVCIVCFVALNEFILEPARRDTLNMQLETRRLREIEREVLAFKARHGDLSALVAQKERELDAAREYLPVELDSEKFVDALYRAAEAWRAQILSVRAGDVEESELQSQTVTVKLESQYVPLLNFVREIVDGKRLAVLEKASIESTGDAFLSCELTFRIFAAR